MALKPDAIVRALLLDADQLLGERKQQEADLKASEAIAIVEKVAVTESSRLLAQAQLIRGHVARYGGKFKPAEAHYLASHRYAVEARDEFLQVASVVGLAIVNGLQNKLDEAIKILTKVTEDHPSYDSGWYNKGLALEKLGRYGEALVAYEQAARVNPRSIDTWINLGLNAGRLGIHEKYLSASEEAIKLDPRDPFAWNNKGSALMSLGRYADALLSANMAVKLNPSYANAWNTRGAALDALGRKEKALAAFDMAIALDPTNARLPWLNKAKVFTDLGRHEAAQEAFANAKKAK